MVKVPYEPTEEVKKGVDELNSLLKDLKDKISQKRKKGINVNLVDYQATNAGSKISYALSSNDITYVEKLKKRILELTQEAESLVYQKSMKEQILDSLKAEKEEEETPSKK